MKNWGWSVSAVRVFDPGNEVRPGAPLLGLAKYIYFLVIIHMNGIDSPDLSREQCLITLLLLTVPSPIFINVTKLQTG